MPEARGLVNFEDWYSMSWEKVRGHSRTLADTRGHSRTLADKVMETTFHWK